MVKLSTIIELPPDDSEAFLEFEAHARQALNDSLRQADHQESWSPYWLDYLTHIREASLEFGIEGFEAWEILPPISHDEFQSFERDILKVTARLKFRVARRIRGDALELETSDREKIRFRVQQLRDEIAAAKLSQSKKDALNGKLDELIGEFEGARVNRGKVLVILTAVAMLLNQTQGVVIKGPETVVAIMDTINMVIGKEDERRALLERYRKPLAIEDKSAKGATSVAQDTGPREDFSADLDDDIPF